MSYPGTGSGTTQTPDERRAEANRILAILLKHVCIDDMTSSERRFMEEIDDADATVSPKQLWWLRDIKGKYAE